MLRIISIGVLVTVTGLGSIACGDDSTSPEDRQTDTVFDVQTDRIETFEDVDIHVMVEEGGGTLSMEHGEMHVEDSGGLGWTHEMEQVGDGFVAHAMFFEPGAHQLHFQGRRQGGNDENFGDHMIEVHRQHRVIGAYWAELSLEPAPIIDGSEATISVHIFEFDGESIGSPATGLTLDSHLHDPDGTEISVTFTESVTGVYEVTRAFGLVGLYELHVTIGSDDGVFHFPVLASIDDIGTGGHGHGGGHHGMRP